MDRAMSQYVDLAICIVLLIVLTGFTANLLTRLLIRLGVGGG